jgi:hypothetical protein
MDFLFDHHVINGLVPKADNFDTSATTDWISFANYGRMTFIIHTGNATSDTANGTVTLLASAVAAGTTTTALPFKYRVCASSTTVDTWGALTDAPATGFSMTAGDNYIYSIEITEDQVVGTIDAKGFVALKVTEVTNDPIVAGVLIILSDPRYPQAVPVQAIA